MSGQLLRRNATALLLNGVNSHCLLARAKNVSFDQPIKQLPDYNEFNHNNDERYISRMQEAQKHQNNAWNLTELLKKQ